MLSTASLAFTQNSAQLQQLLGLSKVAESNSAVLEEDSTKQHTFFIGEKAPDVEEKKWEKEVITRLSSEIAEQFPELKGLVILRVALAILNLYKAAKSNSFVGVSKNLCSSLVRLIQAPRMSENYIEILTEQIKYLLGFNVEQNRPALDKLLGLYNNAIKSHSGTAWLYLDRAAYALPHSERSYEDVQYHLGMAEFLLVTKIDPDPSIMNEFHLVKRNAALIFGQFKECGEQHKRYLSLLNDKQEKFQAHVDFLDAAYVTAQQAERIGANNALDYYLFINDLGMTSNMTDKIARDIERLQNKWSKVFGAKVTPTGSNLESLLSSIESASSLQTEALAIAEKNAQEYKNKQKNNMKQDEKKKQDDLLEKAEKKRLKNEAKQKRRIENERLKQEAKKIVAEKAEQERIRLEALEKLAVERRNLKEMHLKREAEEKLRLKARRLENATRQKAIQAENAAIEKEIKLAIDDMLLTLVKEARREKKDERKKAKALLESTVATKPSAFVSVVSELTEAVNTFAEVTVEHASIHAQELADVVSESRSEDPQALVETTAVISSVVPQELDTLDVNQDAQNIVDIDTSTNRPELFPEMQEDAHNLGVWPEEAMPTYSHSIYQQTTPWGMMSGYVPFNGVMMPEMQAAMYQQQFQYYVESGMQWPMWQMPMLVPVPVPVSVPVPVLVPIAPDRVGYTHMPSQPANNRPNQNDILSIYPSNFFQASRRQKKFNMRNETQRYLTTPSHNKGGTRN